MGFERDGREMLIVVAKATYALPRQGEEASLLPDQVPLVEADEFSGKPGFSAPTYETDYAHRKPFCDVLLLGSAYAPPGRRVLRTSVGLKVGSVVKAFSVVGERVWRRQIFGVGASEPQPFQTLPISYDCAYGGTDCSREAQGHTDAFLPNPVGRGYWKHAEAIDGQPLPCTEQLDRPIDSPGANYVPMAFSPLGRHWTPRSGYVGTYDDRWKETRAPLWPDDFDYRYFQAAPPDQLIPYPQGGEEVVLRNLTPDGHRAFRLPALHMPVMVCLCNGRDVDLAANPDTLVIEPDRERFTVTWRANLPLERSVFDVKEILVGELPPSWHRERRFPGKTYFRNLAEAVRARRRGES